MWRYVGFYLGISPTILTRYFSTISTADKFLASTVIDLFSEDEPLNISLMPTIPILKAVSNRPPTNTSFEYNCAVTRYLLGPELAAHLGIPPTSFQTSLLVHATILFYQLPLWFALWYPRKGWAVKRREVLSEIMARSVRWNLGMRRPHFRPRTDVSDTSGLGLGGDLAIGVGESESVQPDFAGGKVMMRKWREIIVEMVLAHVAVVGLVAVLMAYVTLYHT